MSSTVDQTADERHFTMTQGDHLNAVFPVQTSDGSAADLTAYTTAAVVFGRDKEISVTPAVTKEGSSLRMEITPAQSATLGATNFYQIELANVDRSQVITIVEGKITMVESYV